MPGSSGSACAEALVQLGAQLLEPGGREVPVAGALDALRLAEVAQRLDRDGRVDRRAEVAALQPLEALRVEAPRRARVEHRAAADGRRRAQDHPVAARRHDRLRQPQLREAPAPDDARPRVRRAEVHLHVGRDLRELLERDVEPVGDGEGARLDERVAAARAPTARSPAARPRPAARPPRARPAGRAPARSARARRARAARPAARRPRRSSPTRASRSRPCRSRAA